VLVVDDHRDLRIGFENRFVRELKTVGASGFTTYDLMSLNEIKQDKQAAAARLSGGGAGSLIILRLMNLGSKYHETQPGGERYAGVVTGIENTGWYDYFSMGYMAMSPTYGSQKISLTLETSLYDLKTEKRLWSGVSQTVLTDSMDRVAEMDPLVEKIIATMRKDGVIR